MANLNVSTWYTDSAQWSNVAAWAALTSYPVGSLVRQLAAPTVNNERVFVQTNPTTHVSGAAEPTWTITRYGATSDGTCTWYECTGNPAVNGDTTNAQTWAKQHASSTTVTAGLIIYDATSGALQIVTTGGTIGSSVPTFSATAGVTTSDNSATWTSLGAASGFTKWAAPHDRLANAFASTWGAAGNTFFLGDDHAETQASAMSLTPPTGGAISQVFCVDHTASVPPGGSNLKTTATITTTGANAIQFINATSNSAGYFYGIGFSSATGSGNQSMGFGWPSEPNLQELIFDSCNLALANTGSSGRFNIGESTGPLRMILRNTTVSFGAAGQGITCAAGGIGLSWRNTPSAIGGTTPTTLFIAATNGASCNIDIEGVDLSALGSGKTIFQANAAAIVGQLLNCKLGASVTIAATPTGPGQRVDYVNCATGSTPLHGRFMYQGTQAVESTVVRTGVTGGNNGNTWLVTTTANDSRAAPFETFALRVKCVAGTPVTIYLNSITDLATDATALTSADIWMEAQVMDNSGNCISDLYTTAPANLLTAGSALTSGASSGSWTTTGLTTPDARNQSLTFTPEISGDIDVSIKVARASLSTLRVDPYITA